MSAAAKVEIGERNNDDVLDVAASLNLEEKKFLLAVERGDLSTVRRMLQRAHKYQNLNVNCMDSLGRSALTLAIDAENLEMLELLVVMGVDAKDALLHAISVEFVEAVELLLDHEDTIHRDDDLYSWQRVDASTATFSADTTPLVLAAHRNNYEILKLLLDRGATLPMPHDIKCGCDNCIRNTKEDSLRHSLSRVNEYRALASPSLIALSSTDPILTSFQLSFELKKLAFAEPECKTEYLELRRQCQQFAVDLLQQSRSSQELSIILNHDNEDSEEDVIKLTRLKLAIEYKQKKFVAHPHIQQLLAAIWYEGVPGFRRKSALNKCLIIFKVAVLFPFYCLLYMIAPNTKQAKIIRQPFMKFLIHASSYIYFLILLILVSQVHKADANMQKLRGQPPVHLEYVLLVYIAGLVYDELNQIFVQGIRNYLKNLWNFIDFTRNTLYIAVIVLRIAAYIQQAQEIRDDPRRANIPMQDWDAYDPQLIAEGLFAAANIFSSLKLVYLFSINPHLGPLQISLGRIIIDIVKFFFIYTLVLFAFACGLNQLLWYFSDLERKKCFSNNGKPNWEKYGAACTKWRGFSNVFESIQSLFWASFGMIDLNQFELEGIKSYTRFWGLLMFGSYSVINIIVLLNLLIAMMSNSYASIDCRSDTEWKFARTKLWISYFEDSAILPPPFNVFPSVQPLMHLMKWCCCRSGKIKARSARTEDVRYVHVMRALVWRYITSAHRKAEESFVTEDDINEIKNDISSFRYEMLEVLNRNGMDVSCVKKKEKSAACKRMKVWERRLMKDFKVAPISSSDISIDSIQKSSEKGEYLSKFRKVAKLALVQHHWRKLTTKSSSRAQNNVSAVARKQRNLFKAKNIPQAAEENVFKLIEDATLNGINPAQS